MSGDEVVRTFPLVVTQLGIGFKLRPLSSCSPSLIGSAIPAADQLHVSCAGASINFGDSHAILLETLTAKVSGNLSLPAASTETSQLSERQGCCLDIAADEEEPHFLSLP